MLLAFDAATSTSLMPRECRMGTCVSDSAPPAIGDVGVAERDLVGRVGDGLIGRRAGTTHRVGLQRAGKCGSNATSRAMLGATTDGSTVP